VRISVVVPFRDEEAHLAQCLAALAAQEGSDGVHEVVAVDDRSSDRSPEIVRGFPNVRLLTSAAPGPYAARNLGVAETNGDVVAFTDGDCEPAPDWLARIAAAFDDPDVCIVLGNRHPAGDSFALGLLSAYDRAKEEYVFGELRADLYYGLTSNLAVRRDAFDHVGPFAERRRGADTLFVRSLLDRRGTRAFVYSPDVRVRHLEIRRAADYYRKAFVYGRSMKPLDGVMSGRSLRTAERFEVWRSTVRREPFSRVLSAALLALLGGGAACWELGRLTAFVPSRRGR